MWCAPRARWLSGRAARRAGKAGSVCQAASAQVQAGSALHRQLSRLSARLPSSSPSGRRPGGHRRRRGGCGRRPTCAHSRPVEGGLGVGQVRPGAAWAWCQGSYGCTRAVQDSEKRNSASKVGVLLMPSLNNANRPQVPLARLMSMPAVPHSAPPQCTRPHAPPLNCKSSHA